MRHILSGHPPPIHTSPPDTHTPTHTHPRPSPVALPDLLHICVLLGRPIVPLALLICFGAVEPVHCEADADAETAAEDDEEDDEGRWDWVAHVVARLEGEVGLEEWCGGGGVGDVHLDRVVGLWR
jgi:hypothetical protein